MTAFASIMEVNKDGQVDGEKEEELPFSDEEISTAFKVIEHCYELEERNGYRSQEAHPPRLKPLMKLLRRLFRLMTQHRLDGLDLETFIQRRSRHIVKRRLESLQKEDERKRNRCTLVAKRKENRQNLIENIRKEMGPVKAEHMSQAIVPDGRVREDMEIKEISDDIGDQAGDGEEGDVEARVTVRAKRCYTCRQKYHQIHHFYHCLCKTCGDINWTKRRQSEDLTGKIALVTGARIKIGYQIVLKLLRSGATVIVTTRFPLDAAERYAKEHDYKVWENRLTIYGLDFRDLQRIESFCAYLHQNIPKLDILINNAAQTIQKPQEFYANLTDSKMTPALAADYERPKTVKFWDPASANLALQNSSSNVPCIAPTSPSIQQLVRFPSQDERMHMVDVNGQMIDDRAVNSWKLKLDQVSTGELAEVLIINSIAPFVLCSKLKPLLMKVYQTENQYSQVVNVSAMEGCFTKWKSGNHPHTNMAKAAMNMITRTCAEDYYRQGRILMNSVDTGWVNDENPAPQAAAIHAKYGFVTPIDEIDGAARVLDPVYDRVIHPNRNPPHYGLFFKDYKKRDW